MKKRADYSSTKVKTRILLTKVSYRRVKQSDFNNQNFVIYILSFMVQNFNPVNLDIKLEVEKERDMVKLMWDMRVPHEFVSFILQQENYNIISQPNLTYQKANNIVKAYLFEDWNRINHLKYKIAERFELSISKSVIHIELKFDGSYKSYFQWILNEFDAQQKTDFHIFSNQNTKYLVYLFNDFQNSIGESLIKIRHTLVTDNYLAAEEIQNQDLLNVLLKFSNLIIHQFDLMKIFYYQQLKMLQLLNEFIQ